MTPAELHASARCDLCAVGRTHEHEPVELRGRCHPTAGLRVRYVPEQRVLEAACRTCGLPVLSLELAGAT